MAIPSKAHLSVLPGPSPVRRGLGFRVIEPLLVSTDAAVIVVSAILGSLAYELLVDGSIGDWDALVGPGFVAWLGYAAAAHRVGLFSVRDLLQRDHGGRAVMTSWAVAMLFLAVVLFLLKAGAEVSRGAVVCFAVLGGALLVLWRRPVKHGLRAALVRGILGGRRALLVGTPNELALYDRHELLVRFGLDEVERIVLGVHDAAEPGVWARKAAFERVLERARATYAEEIVIALPWANMAQIDKMLERFRVSPLPVRLLPDRAVSAVLARQSGPRGPFMVEVQRAPLSSLERSLKRTLDIAVAATSLVLLAPLMLAAAAAIKLESAGPVIFRQRRHGFNGQPFLIYKFRTMTVLEDGPTVVQARRNDPRVTRVGRFLRATSIDELPQLVNVLRGDMSIVGPRPHAVAHDNEYGATIANYVYRHHVKPGITGWAQIHGCRGETPRIELMERRVTLDLWYVDNWSIGLDIQVIMRTAFELLRPRNAF